MFINDMFPSNFLKSSDVADGSLQLVIASVQKERMQQTDDEKGVVRFHGENRGLILNRTNSNTIVESYGEHTEAWIGKSLVLFSAMTGFQGKNVPCLRVKVPAAPVQPVVAQTPNDEPPF